MHFKKEKKQANVYKSTPTVNDEKYFHKFMHTIHAKILEIDTLQLIINFGSQKTLQLLFYGKVFISI